MIARLRGQLIEKNPPQLLIEVNGVGYEVDAPMSTFFRLPEVGAEVVLFTHLVVREDSHTLFGFASLRERALFRHLIRITGVGARLALTVLSGVTPEEFASLIEHNDTRALTRLPGIGKKTAERLMIEMRDKLDALPSAVPDGSQAVRRDGTGQGAASAMQEAVAALIALGYKAPEASRMVQRIDDKLDMPSEELIRKALQAAGTQA